MNAEERLAAIVGALESAGLSCLVMGGHAVRFYGLERNTIEFDLHLAPDRWNDLLAIVSAIPHLSGSVSEGNSWRPDAFRRFQIGRLPDGREEWLEFWKHNHLLPPFSDLYQRREIGPYGGRLLAFLSLPDLIRSKETERQHDWQDVGILEEFLDARHLAGVRGGTLSLGEGLAQLRSRIGLESFQQANLLTDPAPVAAALGRASHPVTQALLLPFAPQAPVATALPSIEPVVLTRLRNVVPAGGLHLALLEAVRRQYRQFHQDRDRADKEAIRNAAEKNTP